MNITLPKGVGYIIKELNKNGHEAYVVGGCIRDILIGLQPKDYDITTSANPDEVTRIFKKTIPTGIEHGTVGVVTTDGIYDVTTYRADGEYINSRYPTNVIFIDDLVEDLRRRDITINAIAYNTEKGIIDPFEGTEDIKGKIIRAVGNPILRFKEDALRILRAIRLATTLNFNIEEKTLFGIVETMDGLQFISVERIREELNTILLSKKPSRGLSMLFHLGIMKYVIPEIMTMAVFNQFNPHHDKDVLGHTLDVVDHVPAKLHLRLAALFHDCGKPGTFSVDRNGIGHFYGHEMRSVEIAEASMNRLKYDKKTIRKVLTLISNHMISVNMKNELKLKKLIQKLEKENINDLFELKTADFISKPESGNAMLFEINGLRDRMFEIIDRKDPLHIRDLEVNGQDLMDLGIKEGREIGTILNGLLERVLYEPHLNEKETLLNIVRKELNE